MLSVVICAWNEEKNLRKCLHSVSGLADEIIVVIDKDTTDGTALIAKEFNARIYYHAHTGIVEKMRNFAISKAKGSWILLLDADESIPGSLGDTIQKIVIKPQADYFRVPRKNTIFGKWIKSNHWWPDYVYRLFKKGSVTWHDEIHSIPMTTGIGFDLPAVEDNAIEHHNYTNVSQYILRMDRYTDHQVEEMILNKIKFNWTDVIIRPVKEFNTHYFARKGYEDGLHGLSLSLLQSFSELILMLKLWQSEGFKSQPINIQTVKGEFIKIFRETEWWYLETLIKTSFLLKSLWYKVVRKILI